MLSESIASGPLTPHLTYFRGALELDLDKLLACLAGSELCTLVLDRPKKSRRNAEAHVASKKIVRSLHRTCPHLQHLYLRYSVEEPKRLSGAIGNLHNLRTLHVAPGNRIPRINPLLRKLSTLPFLSELAIPLGGVDPGDEPVSDGFSGLRVLAVECQHSSELLEGELLQTMPPLTRLEQLKLRLPPFDLVTSSLPQVYTSIFSTSASTLTTIRLDLRRGAEAGETDHMVAHALLSSLEPLENLVDVEVSLNDIAHFTDEDLLTIAELWPRLSKLRISWVSAESDTDFEEELAPTYGTVVDFVWQHPHLWELRLTEVSLRDLDLQRRATCGWLSWYVSGFRVEEDRIRDPAQLANILNILYPHLHAKPPDYHCAGVQPLWREVMHRLDRLWIERHTCSRCNNAERRKLH